MERDPAFYYLFCNHWSQGGIGYAFPSGYYGGRRYERTFSSAYTIYKTLEAADRFPGLKPALELDAYLYEAVAEEDPACLERLREYVAAGRVSIEGGTYGQPFGQDYGWESNVRQLTYGRRTIRQLIGVEVDAFLVEEQWFHPQLPQLLRLSGFRWASLQNQNSGRVRPVPYPVIRWVGLDGTAIPTIPANPFMVSCVYQFQTYSAELLEALGRWEAPLLTQWIEIWPPGYDWGASATPFAAAINQVLSLGAQSVGLSEYFERVVAGRETELPEIRIHQDESNYFNAWYQGGGWGSDGDQIIYLDRLAEKTLLLLEAACAMVASCMGGNDTTDELPRLERLWKRLLVLQNHDFTVARVYRCVYGGVETRLGELAKAEYRWIINEASQTAQRRLEALANARKDTCLGVFNADGVAGPRPVRVRLPWGDSTREPVLIQNGKPVAQQWKPTGRGEIEGLAVVHVPAVGLAGLQITQQARPTGSGMTEHVVGAATVSSRNLSARWVPERRQVHLVHEPSGVELWISPFSGPIGKMNEHDHFLYHALNPSRKAYAFYFDGVIGAPDWLPPAVVSVAESGPLRHTLKLHMDVYTLRETETPAAWVESMVSLYDVDGNDFVEVINECYAGVPMAVQCEAVFTHHLEAEYVRDYPFGEEPTRLSDIYTNSYLRVTDGVRGFTITHAGTQRVRLVQVPGGHQIRFLQARDKIFGEYQWRFAIFFGRHAPHESARLTRWWQGVVALVPGASALNWLELHPPQVLLSAVYPEEGRLVIRLVNYSESPVHGPLLTVARPYRTGAWVDLEGKVLRPARLTVQNTYTTVEGDLRAWEIGTVALS